MGLAAPRRKTKYDIDPRNNAWANDENKFGQKLMEKFGWEKGKGLGAQEDGETENIKVKVKNDKQGIGATNDYSDTWLDHQDDFNSILAALNTSHSAPGSGTATPTNEESTDAVAGSMEERSKSSKSRVHYKKFAQSKDLTRADAADFDALFGRRKAFEKRSKKAKKAAQSEPASPFAGMTPLGTTPLGGRSPRKEESDVASERDADGSHDKEFDAEGNLRTVTSALSVSDYFAKKMAELKGKNGRVNAAVDQFCENSCRQFKENREKGEMKEEEEQKPAAGEEEEVEATDKPEVYAQEKFQKAALSVQQYFELKMKEKKTKEAAANADAENNNLVDVVATASEAGGEGGEKPKKKKKKMKDQSGDSQEGKLEDGVEAAAAGEAAKTTPEATEKRKKKKKQKQTIDENKLEDELERAKVAEKLSQTEATNQSADQLVAGNEAPERKKKEKKRKLERAGETTEPAEVAAEPQKKKKKRKEKKEILTAPGESEAETVKGGVYPEPPKEEKKGILTAPGVAVDSGGLTVKGNVDPGPPKKKKKKRKLLTAPGEAEGLAVKCHVDPEPPMKKKKKKSETEGNDGEFVKKKNKKRKL